jgi:hypothetical protein
MIPDVIRDAVAEVAGNRGDATRLDSKKGHGPELQNRLGSRRGLQSSSHACFWESPMPTYAAPCWQNCSPSTCFFAWLARSPIPAHVIETTRVFIENAAIQAISTQWSRSAGWTADNRRSDHLRKYQVEIDQVLREINERDSVELTASNSQSAAQEARKQTVPQRPKYQPSPCFERARVSRSDVDLLVSKEISFLCLSRSPCPIFEFTVLACNAAYS